MKTELDILRDVSARLDAAGIEYMVTGSDAMNYYAQPRMTRDTTSELETKRQLCERLYGDEVDVAAFVQSLTKS